MKQSNMKKMLMAGLLLAAVPATTLFAQSADDKKESKEMQTIVITREGNQKGKTVIEIDGDKVKVDGKDARDSKDVTVNVNTFRSSDMMRYKVRGNAMGSGTYTFTESKKSPMLGVVTEGNDKGAEISSVVDESGADKAGLKKGDIITTIDGKKITSTDDVTEIVRGHKVGDKVSITYLRDNKEQKATAELGKWKGIDMGAINIPQLNELGQQFREFNPTVRTPMNMNINGELFRTGRPRLGLTIQDTDEGNGVKITGVDDESNAAKAGLKNDDIILAIDDKEVKSTDDVSRITREKDKNSFNFKIKRNGKTQTIELKIPKKLKTVDL